MQVEAKTNTVWHVPQIVKAIFMADDAAGLCGWVQAPVSYTHLTLPTNREV